VVVYNAIFKNPIGFLRVPEVVWAALLQMLASTTTILAHLSRG
jgi:hypothetical protein